MDSVQDFFTLEWQPHQPNHRGVFLKYLLVVTIICLVATHWLLYRITDSTIPPQRQQLAHACEYFGLKNEQNVQEEYKMKSQELTIKFTINLHLAYHNKSIYLSHGL